MSDIIPSFDNDPIPPETHSINKTSDTSSTSSSFHIFIKPSTRNAIFTFMVLISLFTNLDGGIIPNATSSIQATLNIKEGEMGNYSSSDYLGRIIGSILFVFLINKINRLLLLVLTLIIKSVTLIIPFIILHYNFNPNYLYITCFICRLISGISQVYYTIYLPVWCDQYGKKSSNTLMIMLIQLGLPVGIVLGYGIEELVAKWEVSFVIQGLICCVIAFCLLPFPLFYFSFDLVLVDGTECEMKPNTQNDPLKEFTQHNSHNNIFRNICKIISEKVYLFTGFSNSVIFFGMAVIQFWISVYMKDVLGITNENTIFLIFAAVCVTSPPIGVLVGGVIGNKLGGYANKRASLLCVVFGVVACVFGIGVGFLPRSVHVSFAVGLWIYFFCVSAMSPLQTGIIIAALPEHLRGDGFSIMNVFLNVFGNLPGASVYGWIYEKYNREQVALRWTMSYNLFGLVCMVLGMVFRYRKVDGKGSADNKEDDIENDGEMVVSQLFKDE